ncbi:MAG: rhodanese-like domain-containing protein [Planctomycetota bacterium]
MLFRRMYDSDLAHASYLIGCPGTREAIVIDAARDIDRYLAEAAREGLRIVAAAETHIHADFLSGTRELAEQLGARVLVSAEGGPDWQYGWLDAKAGGGSYEHQRLRHGDRFRLGGVEFEVAHTPGHTPEHVSFFVTDRRGGATDPMGIVTGDFVFVGDLGRPDLLETAAGQVGSQEEGARQLFHSARRFLELPDYLQVWPAHGAGSACGKALGATPQSTVGYERRFNPALLQLATERGFMDYMLDGQPEPPYYFGRMKRENRDGPPLLGALPRQRVLDADAAQRLDRSRHVIVDTRPWPEFRAGHLPGSLWSPLGSNLIATCGSYIAADQEVCLVVDDEQLDRAVRCLVRIGLSAVTAQVRPQSLAGGSALGLVSTPEIDVAEFAQRLARGDGGPLDVRRAAEFAQGRIPGATNLAHTRLLPRLAEVPRDRPLVVSCKSGVRSAIACAFLERQGVDVTNLRGGFDAWKRTLNLEIELGDAPGAPGAQ